MIEKDPGENKNRLEFLSESDIEMAQEMAKGAGFKLEVIKNIFRPYVLLSNRPDSEGNYEIFFESTILHDVVCVLRGYQIAKERKA